MTYKKTAFKCENMKIAWSSLSSLATADDNVLNTQSNDISYRKEQLRRLQEEVIEMEDLKTGVSITDLGLNDFRMDLLNYIKANGDLANVPTGMNAVVPADPARGLPPGVMFTLRNRNNGVNKIGRASCRERV